jgi:hypothetical protein
MEIKIYKKNPVYRMGDIVNATGIRWANDRFTILSSPEYEGTILRLFLEHLIYLKPENAASFDYWQTLRDITKDKAALLEYARPTESDIVMHLRLGDILTEKEESRWRIDETSGYFDKYRRKGVLNYYEDFFKRIKLKEQYPKHTLKIVTALHFGANDINNKYFHSAEAEEKSHEVVGSIKEQLKELDYKYEIISQDTDADFAYMVHSKFFIKGMSGMSDLVLKCLPDNARIIEERRSKRNRGDKIPPNVFTAQKVNGAPAFKYQSDEYDNLSSEEKEYIDKKIKRDLSY